MSSVTVKKIGITKLDTDAIVNAANEGLCEGGGVCGAIFKEAGTENLTKACKSIGGCETGSAVITPGFNLKAKYIIHAVGPRWIDGEHGEPSLLYDAYKSALELARENDCHSIGFPLISSGIFKYPKKKAWRKAIRACETFIKKNPNYDIEIVFAVLDDEMLNLGQKTIEDIMNKSDIDDYYERSSVPSISKDVEMKAEAFCRKYQVLLRALYEDDELREWCKGYSPYEIVKNHKQLYKDIIHEFFKQAYDDGIVIYEYDLILKKNKLNKKDIQAPTKEWVKNQSKEVIISCIACHFRMDHFCEGSLMNYSIANGYLLNLIQGYIEKCN